MGVRKIPSSFASTALIFTPLGRDATVAKQLLGELRIPAFVCRSLDELVTALGDRIHFVVVSEETIRSADLRSVANWVAAQPPWSDLPFIVMTRRRDGATYHPDTPRLAELLSNVTFLERPFHPLTFASVARTAFNGRLRQYEARALIQELRESEQLLEQRVVERTAELELAHQIVMSEIKQREATEKKLHHSQKMETIGQLTGGVAHDFNNLLMAVIGNLDLLRKRIPQEDRFIRLIDGASQGAQRGAALTQRLLAFARRQDLTVEPTDLGQLVVGMTNLMERSVGSRIELSIHVPETLPSVLVDPNQIELAILNLVVNARDAMPDGGRLRIELDEILQEEKGGDQRYVRVSVSDTGCGMDSATLNKATEPFFSTKEIGKGTGLGLSMIHGLTKQLGGSLKLSSRLGEGTRAELWLPSTSEPATRQAAYAPQAKAHSRGCLTVLVVDDDILIASSTAMMVEDLGHEVFEANGPIQALDILRDRDNIDLLITDFSMPKMNGVQLASAAKDLRPQLRILLATGYADIPVGSETTLQRIGKPYQQDQLANAIASAMKAS